MTEPMALDAKALEAARDKLWEDLRYQGTRHSRERNDELAEQVVLVYLATLPPPAAGEGPEPVNPQRDRELIEAVHDIGGRIFSGQIPTSQEPAAVQKIVDLVFARAATPAARAAVLEPSDGALLSMMNALHANVPESDRPASKSDFSDEQWTRVQNAGRAFLVALKEKT